MPGQPNVKVEADDQEMENQSNQSQRDATGAASAERWSIWPAAEEVSLASGSMQDITASILQKERSYLARIESLSKVVAEQSAKLSRYKQRVSEIKDVKASREKAEQMMREANVKATQSEMEMQRAELMLHGADMKLHNAQFKMDEAKEKMIEAQTMMESARKIKQENLQLIAQLNSYHSALKNCSQTMANELNGIEVNKSPSFAAFPLVPPP